MNGILPDQTYEKFKSLSIYFVVLFDIIWPCEKSISVSGKFLQYR
jgi:hypothetical protein